MLPKYQGYLVRHPAPPRLAIDPAPFGYFEYAYAMKCRLRRFKAQDKPFMSLGYPNSEARKRIEHAPEAPCYKPQGEHKL